MSRLTLGHFSRTGIQDCHNVIDASSHREAWRTLGYPTDPEAAINVVRAAWGDDADGRKDWIAQMPIEDYEGLDPEACYREWRASWQACAVRYVRTWIVEWSADRDE